LAADTAQTLFSDTTAYAEWHAKWQAHAPDPALMARTNPAVIPRNHRIQEAITACDAGDDAPFNALWEVLRDPFAETEANAAYRLPATPEEAVTRTFCGT